MERISVWVKEKNELRFMMNHFTEKGIKWQLRKNMRNGFYGVFIEKKPKQPKRQTWREDKIAPDRIAWENRR